MAKVADLYGDLGLRTKAWSDGAEKAIDALDKLSKKWEKFANEAATASAAVAAGIGGALALASQSNEHAVLLMGQFQDATRSLAGEVVNAFTPAIQHATKFIQGMADWFARLNPTVKTLMSYAAEAVVIFGGLAFAVGRVASVAGMVADALELLGPLWATTIAPALPLILGIAAAVGVLIVVVAYIRKAWVQNWGGIQEKTAEVLKWIAAKFAYVKDFFAGQIKLMVHLWAEGLRKLASGAEAFLSFFGVKVDAGLLRKFADWAEGSASTDIWEGFKDGALKAFDLIKRAATDVKDTVGDLGSAINKALGLFDMNKHAVTGRVLGEQMLRGPGLAAHVTQPNALQIQSAAPPLPNWDIDLIKLNMKTFINAFGKSMMEALKSSTGLIGSVISAAMEGMATGGPFAALGQALAVLVTSSKGFQETIQMVNAIVQQVADVLGMVFVAVQPLLGAVYDLIQGALPLLAPVFDFLGRVLDPLLAPLEILGALLATLAPLFTILMGVLRLVMGPLDILANTALRAFFEIVKFLAVVILKIVQFIAPLWNGILSTIAGVLRFIGDFQIFGAKPFAALTDWADSIEGAMIDTDALAQQLHDLEGLTWEAAQAKAKETAAVIKATNATNKATEALSNVPSWYKLNAARYAAADAGPVSIATPVPVPAPPPAPAGGGSTGGGAGPRGGGGNVDDRTGGGGIVIQVNGAGDPAEVARRVLNLLKQSNLRETGTTRQAAPRFTTA